MKLAVYGFVDEHGGSVVSAHFLLLNELLARGHRIDFYAIEGWVTPGRLAEHSNLRYIPVRRELCRRVYRLLDHLPGAKLRTLATGAFGQFARHLDWQPIGDRIAREHRWEPYTALVSLGLLSPWKVSGLPTVSWTQGCPSGEAGWYHTHPAAVARFLGPGYLPLLAAGYLWKYLETRPQLRLSDVVIAESGWSAGRWRRFGVPARKLVALPYPFDTAAFAPVRAEPSEEVRLLHLGRVVPRKRVDLLLEALPIVRRIDPSIRVRIVGGSPYPRMAAWLERAAKAAGAEWTPAVPRAEVPTLLARTDVVIQPSEHENFGAAVAEGLLAGRAALIGPTNGTCDHLDPTPAVVRFSAYTPDALAAGMIEAANRVRSKSIAGGRVAAVRVFDLPTVADQFEDVVKRAAG